MQIYNNIYMPSTFRILNQKLRSLDGKNISKTQNIFKCTPFASCYGILLWQGIVNATEMNHLDVCVRVYE